MSIHTQANGDSDVFDEGSSRDLGGALRRCNGGFEYPAPAPDSKDAQESEPSQVSGGPLGDGAESLG